MIAAGHKMKIAMVIAVLFSSAGSRTCVFLLPSPMWFNLPDLAAAYIPMGYLAGLIATRGSRPL
ncbi:hypothetical protein BH20ACI2_BH20ACI2_27810 [soil metagenome]